MLPQFNSFQNASRQTPEEREHKISKEKEHSDLSAKLYDYIESQTDYIANAPAKDKDETIKRVKDQIDYMLSLKSPLLYTMNPYNELNKVMWKSIGAVMMSDKSREKIKACVERG